MKKIILTTLFVAFINMFSWAQINKGLIELGETYREFSSKNNPSDSIIATLDKYDTTELSFAADLIQEAIKRKNNVLSDKFLKRPTDTDLKLVYIISQVWANLGKEAPRDPKILVEELLETEIQTYKLVDSYYSFLFVCYINKVEKVLEADLSELDFQLNTYGLRDETEKGIFFLVSIRFNGMLIIGFLSKKKSPNYSVIHYLISKYPTYNGKPYCQFTELDFPDFNFMFSSDPEPKSYKAYYIDMYYELLLAHLNSLKSFGDKEQINDLMAESILSKEMYFKYSKREEELKKLLAKYNK